MDYYSMNRKQLQALCKQHNIPANSASSLLAHKLSQLLNEKQKPTTRQRTCLKSPIETAGEGEPAVSKKETKKVRFSPDNDSLEYELRSGEKNKDVVIERKSRRKSVANKVDKQVVNDNVELVDDIVQIPVRLTRSRVQVTGKDGVVSNNEKKQGKKVAKDVEKVTDLGKEPGGNLGKVTRSKVHTLNKGGVVQDVEKRNQSLEGTVVSRVRVTRSKVQALIEDGIGSDVNTQVKKSGGRRVAKDAPSVESSREITDIPARVTRTRGQILKEDNGDMVTNPQGEKKRTRKEMKSTDLRINSSNVAPDDNQELPRRKSSRTRGVETVDEDEAEKLGRGKQKKRSKENVAEVPESQHHADKELRKSRRNVAKVEDSKLETVNDKKVTRSKHQREYKLVQQPEEPSDHREKQVVNRRKSVMQKAQGKGIDKPLVGKRESLKATVMFESPTCETRNSVGKTRSKKQSGNLSLIDEGLEDIENFTRSGKDASENEIKVVVNPTTTPKSRKRRGTPIIEDQTVETEFVSPADESPSRSSKSKGKSIAKEQVESSLKTPASRKNNRLDVQKAVPEVNKESSSKKRAKLSGTNQRNSENHSEKSSVKGTPVSMLGNFEPDIEVTDIESTPVIESHRRVTRSAIRTGGKEPSHSAIKEQPTGDAQFSSRKVARFRHDPAVNTAPGRVTRSGIKHGGNAASIFSEKVDKRKQLSQSGHRKQPFDDTQISLPEGAEVRLNLDADTIGVQSEISKTSESVRSPTIVLEENMVMENLNPVSGENASRVESHTTSNIERIPVTMAEKPEGYETTVDAVSDGSHVPNETQEVYVKSTIFSEAEVQVALDSEKPMADENEMDLTKLGATSKGLQIDLMAEEPAISVDKMVVMGENEAGSSAVCHVSAEQSEDKSKELEDQVEPSIIENDMQVVEDDVSFAPLAEGSEQDDLTCKDSLQNDSVDKLEVADNGEGDDEDDSVSVQNPLMNEPVSEDRDVADGLQIDLMAEEPAISVDKMVVMEENEAGSSAVCHVSAEQSEDKSKELEDQVEPSIIENDMQFVEDDGSYAPLAEGSEQDDLTCKDSLQNDSVDKLEVADNGEGDDEDESVSVQNPLMNEPVSEDRDVADGVDALKIDNSDNKEDIITTGESLNEHGESSAGKSVFNCLAMDNSGVEFEVVPSTDNDVHGVPILGECDGEEDIVYAAQSVDEHGELLSGNDVHGIPITGGSDNKEDIISAGQSVAEHGEMSTGVHEIPIFGESSNKEDMVTSAQSVAKHGISLDRSDVAVDDVVDVGNHLTKKLEYEVVPSTSNDVHEVPILGKSDGEDEGAKVTKEGEIDSMSLTVGNMLEDHVMTGSDGDDGGDNAIDCDIDSLPLTSGNMIEDHVLSGSDSKAESNPKPLTDYDVSDTPFLGKDDSNTNRELESTLELSPANDLIESPSSNNDIYDDVPKELETTLEPANAPVSINDVSSDFKNDRLTSNVSSVMNDLNVGGENSDLAPNENTPATTEVSVRSCDQEPDRVFNVIADEVPCDTVGISASVGLFDSSTNLEPSHTHAITVNPHEESILDINKEAVSNILDDTDTENVSGYELKFCELDESFQPKESESYPMSKEQTSEKAEMTTGNDQAKHTVATFDPLDDTISDLPSFLNEDDRDKQGDTSVDWGDCSIEMDEFHCPVAENKSDDVLGKSRKEFPTSVGASSSSEENSRVAADMVNSVKNLEMATRNVANEKSSQEVDLLKENVNADITDEVFNWSDSSLKSLLKTPAVKQARHVKDDQEGVSLLGQDQSTTRIGDVQDDGVDISNQDQCSSLAPATGRISCVKDDEKDASRFITDDRCNRDIAKNGTATHEFDRQWESLGFDGETQGNVTSHISENVTYASVEDCSRKLFENEVDHSSGDGSREDKHFEVAGDQVIQTKQLDLSSEVAGTSHYHASGLKDNSICSDELKKKEETQLKGPAAFDALDIDKGM